MKGVPDQHSANIILIDKLCPLSFHFNFRIHGQENMTALAIRQRFSNAAANGQHNALLVLFVGVKRIGQEYAARRFLDADRLNQDTLA